jgi:CRP-like cAMP-binding protein
MASTEQDGWGPGGQDELMKGATAVSERAAQLKRATMFEAMSGEELEALARLARGRTFADGAVIFRKGDEASGLYVVARGRVKISSGSRDGREVVLNLLGPGEVFGEVALIDGGERTAEAVACEPVRLLVLDRAPVIALLEAKPALMLRMLVTLTRRVRWVSDRLEDAVFLSLPARMAKRLLFLGQHFGVDTSRGRRLTVSLPQRELASHMNVARETVNRLLQEWRDEGLIDIQRGFIVLLKSEQLSAIANAS